jgi:NAD(P)H dehydrogenase (quinone)
MKTVSIVYFSGTGHTAQMAEAVLRGATGLAGVTAQALPIRPEDIVNGKFANEALLEQLTASDAIVFGSPTYMGSVAAQFKAFADATGGIWYQRKWADKLASGFTHSGSPSGDKLSALQYLSLFAAQHGMIWIGNLEITAPSTGDTTINRVGSYLGVMGAGRDDKVDAGDLVTAERLGARVAAQLAREVTIPATLAA